MEDDIKEIVSNNLDYIFVGVSGNIIDLLQEKGIQFSEESALLGMIFALEAKLQEIK